MINKKITIKSAVMCMGLLFATACGHDTPGEQSKEHAEEANAENFAKEGEKDADRVTDVYELNMYEIKSSEQALTKATDAEVKKIAQMMVDAHSKMSTDLQQLATSKGITLPTGLTNEQTRDLDNLNEKSGLDYDKEYLDQMKKGHKDVIDKLQATSDKAEDADIKAMADKALPEVRSHLDMVEATREKVKDMKHDGGVRDEDRKEHKDHHNADHH
jgi:putative membrane protein